MFTSKPSIATSIIRIFVFVIVGIILIILGFVAFFYGSSSIHDRSTLSQVNISLNWIENFYTMQARYPTKIEFDKQFPDFNKIGPKAGYGDDYGSIAPQDYSLWYDLSRQSSDAPGDPQVGEFGYERYYVAWPCPRWTTLLNIGQNDVMSNRGSIVIDNPRGGIFTDFYTGEIYFKHFDGFKFADEKILLLQNLSQPRMFQSANKIIITNGNGVYSYDWDASKLKLSNPQKIGDVPKSCIENTYHYGR